jgi:hypothetical protein
LRVVEGELKVNVEVLKVVSKVNAVVDVDGVVSNVLEGVGIVWDEPKLNVDVLDTVEEPKLNIEGDPKLKFEGVWDDGEPKLIPPKLNKGVVGDEPILNAEVIGFDDEDELELVVEVSGTDNWEDPKLNLKGVDGVVGAIGKAKLNEVTELLNAVDGVGGNVGVVIELKLNAVLVVDGNVEPKLNVGGARLKEEAVENDVKGVRVGEPKLNELLNTVPEELPWPPRLKPVEGTDFVELL